MKEPAGNWFYWLIKGSFYPARTLYFRTRVQGDVPRTGPLILAANHCSWLDPPVLGSTCPRPIRFLITRGVYDQPATRWFYLGMRTIPLRDGGDADHGALRAALRALREGDVVGIFPEGAGLDPQGRLREAQGGAALLAARSGVPVVPVWIAGTHRALPKGARFPMPRRLGVTFGTPFRLELPDEGSGSERLTRAAAELMRRIAELAPPEDAARAQAAGATAPRT